MRKCFALLLFIGFLAPLATGLCASGKIALDFSLPAPENEVHRAYLGLETLDLFFLKQIRAKMVIIEIFSMYCPICQREAAHVNTLFDLIQKDPALKDQVKLIGIGAGNSAYEVDFFKENYGIQFPLFSDGKFEIHKKIGEKGTPFFIGIKPDKNKGVDVFFSQSGEIKDVQAFLKTLVQASGLTF